MIRRRVVRYLLNRPTEGVKINIVRQNVGPSERREYR